jgi:hypothetical protein
MSHRHVSVNIPREKFVEISLNGTTDGEQSGNGGKDGGKDDGKESDIQHTEKQYIILEAINYGKDILFDLCQ